MRRRSVRLAVIAGAVLALVPTAAPAATSGLKARVLIDSGPVVAPASAVAQPKSQPQPESQPVAVAVVTLPTGESVSVTGAPGSEQVSVVKPAPAGPARTMITERSGSQLYAYPVSAQPYLGRFLDRELFNVTRLATASGERQPVRIAYLGSSVKVPGVTVVTAAGGAAGGYLTPSSAAVFGRALADQRTADQALGGAVRTSLFPGVSKISSTALPQGQAEVAATDPKFSLVIKVIGADGNPAGDSAVSVMNVNDGRKVHARPTVDANGVARISVPRGTYSAISYASGSDPQSGRQALWITSVNEFKITDSGRTMTIDHRRATVPAGDATVPKPATRNLYSFDWARSDARSKPYVMEFSMGFYGDEAVFLAPSSAAKVGKLTFLQSWILSQPVPEPTYTYHLATRNTVMPATPTRFTASGLSTVKAAYYGEGTPRTGHIMRDPVFSAELTVPGMYLTVQRGTRRTEYLGSRGGKVAWSEAVAANVDATDSGYLSGPYRSIAAGTTQSVSWFKGPLGATVPWRTGPAGYCWTCRSGNELRLMLSPFSDSYRYHDGSFAVPSGSRTVARFRMYRNGKRIVNRADSIGTDIVVPEGKYTYKAIFDLDRRLMKPAQSTRTKTEMTFTSEKGVGRAVPRSSQCGNVVCRVQSVVQARLSLPIRLDGTVAPARSTVTVTVAQVQYAAPSASRSASLQIRPAGKGWTTVRLKAIGGGRYQGTLDSSKLAGLNVDVRFTGANKAGSTFRQTVLRAYTVAPN